MTKDLDAQQEDRKETQNVGSVGFHIYKTYFRSVNSLVMVVIVSILVIMGQIAISSIDLFVSKW